MFENLTERLDRVFRELRGHARITGEHLDSALRQVRMALLEADVALPVVREFIDEVRKRAEGREVAASLTPGQEVIRIVRDELVRLMASDGASLHLDSKPPVVILLAGLQGAGKTTTAAKLAVWLRGERKKRVLLTSCDVYRPAAIEQLAVLARDNDIAWEPPPEGASPEAIAEAGLKRAKAMLADVLIVDSAGRLHVDDGMMAEIARVHAVLQPADTLFVVDSMMGQDAVKAAAAFSAAVPLTGVILTKVDGDARGGAALSVRHVTGKPILFMGTGERVTEFQPFQAERVVSRILGMGDVLSLIEDVERRTDKEKAEELARKLRKGKGIGLEDFRDQLRQMREMGGVGALLDKLPGAHQLPPGVAAQVDDRRIVHFEAIINSMTPAERRRPEIINGSRKKRIAAGSGTTIQDVNRLLKQFTQMQKMMKRMSRKGGIANLLRGMGGAFPPGGFPR
jgi:signal recognition particle subunit SRP54